MAGGRDFKDTYTIEALLTGNTSRLKSAITRAKKLLDSLENDSGDIEIKGDTKPLDNSIKNARIKVKALKKESATVDIKGDSSNLNSKIAQSQAMIETLKKKASVIEMNASGLESMKNFQTLKVKELDFDGAKVNIAPDFVTKVADGKIKRFKASLKSIPNRVRTWLHADIDKSSFNLVKQLNNTTQDFQRNMSKMARTIESFAVVIKNQIGGAFLSMSTAVVPMITGIVSAVMALGNAIGVVAGGVGGLVGAFGVAGIAGGGWAGMMATVLARYSDEAFVATKESARFAESLSGIKSSWNGVVDANQSKIFDTMSNAIEAVTGALGKLQPMFDGVSKVMLSASKSFKDFLGNSPIAKSFFNMLNTTGVSLFETLLSAVGKFGAGMMQVFNLMQPLMKSVSAGFEAMSDRFLKWSQSVEAEQGFKKFTDYVNKNLPLIRRIFGDTFKGIINLFASFGENSSVVFSKLADMSTAFRTWSSNLKESDGFQKFIEFIQRNAPAMISLIGNVIMTLVNLGIALAPLGEKVLKISDKFFKFTSELLKNNPAVGLVIGAITTLLGIALLIVPVIIQMVALFKNMIAPMLGVAKEGKKASSMLTVLRAAFVFVTGAVGIVIAILTVLVASFVHLWQTNETFKENVIRIWNLVKTHITNAVTAIKTFVESIWGSLVEWWSVHNENIMNVAMVIWSGILLFIENTMATIVPVIKIAWELIKGIIKIALDLILGIVGTVMAILNGDWATAWQTVKDTASKIWETLKEMFTNIWEIIKTAFTTWLEALKTQASETWNWIKENASTIWNAFKDMISQVIETLVIWATLKFEEWKGKIKATFTIIKVIAQTIWETIKAWIVTKVTELVANAMRKFEDFKTKISNVFNAIKTFLSETWTTIKTWVTERITTMVTNAVNRFNNLKTNVTNIFNRVKTFLRNTWMTIKTRVINIIRDLIQGAIDRFNNLKTNVTNIFNAVKSFLSNTWESIKSKVISTVTNLVTNAVNKFNDLKSRATNIFNAVKSFLTDVWNNIKSTVTNTVNNLKNAVTNGFNNVRNTISNIMNGVRNTLTRVWNNIKTGVSNSVNSIRNKVTDVFNSLRDRVSNAMDRVKTAVSNGMTRAKNAVTDKISQFKDAGENIVGSIADGITGAISKVTGAIDGVVSKIRNYLPFSPAKEGPLKDIMKTNISGSIAETINKQRKLPLKAMSKVASGVQKSINSVDASIKPEVVGINNGIRKAQSRASAVMNHTVKAEVNSQPIQANIHFSMGKRDYQTHVSDITQSQNSESQLEERYGV